MTTVIRGSFLTCLLHAHTELKSVVEGADTLYLQCPPLYLGWVSQL